MECFNNIQNGLYIITPVTILNLLERSNNLLKLLDYTIIMIGDIINQARKNKSMKKTVLAEKTDINIGHLTHIEKEQRKPSHKALKSICDSLELPYMPLMNTYDKDLNEEQKQYNLTNYISYRKIPLIESIDDFVDCPIKAKGASFAIKITNDEMLPTIKPDSCVFVEWNTIPENKEIGIFKYNDKILIRRLLLRREKILLRADNKEFKDIPIDTNDTFEIIGKIIVVK